MPTGSEHVRIFRSGITRQIEVDGQPFPFYTKGDLKVDPVKVLVGPSKVERTMGYIVTVPIFVGEVTIEGGGDVLKSTIRDSGE